MASRKDIKCEYSNLQRAVTLSTEVNEGLVQDVPREASDSVFPYSLFLDYNLYEHAELWLPQINILLSPEVTSYVNDREFIVSQHFATTQSWMPLLSRKKLYHELATYSSQSQSDFVILLYCMKLLMWWPPEQDRYSTRNGRTAAYSTATRLLHQAESEGTLTLQLLQAKLLVCLYELGHSIYPTAYLSVGACARYGIALGIDKTNEASPTNQATDPIVLEEMRRCWWVVIILDRSENLLLLVTAADFTAASLLPMALQ